MVINEAGENLGVMKTNDALKLAQEQDLDLIEVSPLANPPVCRIMNLGKWQYLQSQKTKKQKTFDTKIVRLSFKIAEHDRKVRLNQSSKFLSKGHKVKIDMRLRGRERAYPNQGREMVQKFIADLGSQVVVEQAATVENVTISALIAKKP